MNRQQKLDLELSATADRKKSEVKIVGSKADNKKTIIILFLITLVLSLFFYFKASLPQILKELTAPDKIIIEKKSID